MTTLERSIGIAAPASTSYKPWTRFERVPQFMVELEGDRIGGWRGELPAKEDAAQKQREQ